ncbi:MAG: hypothetical protein AAFY60_03450, partial [Myxococcota bacterium]
MACVLLGSAAPDADKGGRIAVAQTALGPVYEHQVRSYRKFAVKEPYNLELNVANISVLRHFEREEQKPPSSQIHATEWRVQSYAISLLTQELTQQSLPDEHALLAAYNRQRESFRRAPRWTLHNIHIPATTDVEFEKAKKTLSSIRARLLSGADFA